MFDESYDWLAMALALEVPIHDTVSRQVLENEYNNLINTNQRNFQVNLLLKNVCSLICLDVSHKF